MEHSKRLELFETARGRYSAFLTSVLWKLTGDRELFTEAMQYALFAMWRYVEKLKDETATSYIYRIALSANSKAWRNRIGKNGEIPNDLDMENIRRILLHSCGGDLIRHNVLLI